MDEIIETWTSIIEKYSQAKNDTLPYEELVVFRVFSFICDVEMNGVSGALYNSSPKSGTNQYQWTNLHLTAEALVTIGDAETAQLLTETATVFESLSNLSLRTWGEYMEAAETKLSDDIWDTIDARIQKIYDFLEVYTREHLL
ncbi:MAG: hypothetical protein U0Z26_17120 [Anaerolineales bacterium]